MTVRLNDIEQRVLGVLIEKSLTQPGAYPMTVNAITLGSNQKQNREPVVEYGEGEVSVGLRGLEHLQLAAQAPPAIGARAVRFRHRAVEVFRWDRREQAIMAELLLRGRQTPGELRTHASRMTPFADLESVLATLTALRAYDPPFVEELQREPGRSANRFRHLLATGSTPPVAALTAAVPRPAEPNAAVSSVATFNDKVGVTPAAGAQGALTLAERVARLEVEVERLQGVVAAMKCAGQSSFDADRPAGV